MANYTPFSMDFKFGSDLNKVTLARKLHPITLYYYEYKFHFVVFSIHNTTDGCGGFSLS